MIQKVADRGFIEKKNGSVNNETNGKQKRGGSAIARKKQFSHI